MTSTTTATEKGDLLSYGQIVLFGDSITEQSFNRDHYGYGSGLADTFARVLDIINRGFSGYTSRQAVQLLPRIFPSRDDNVKLVILFFGANDAVLPSNDQHVPIEEYINNCRYILTSEQLKQKVVAVIPPPIEEHSHAIDFGKTRTAERTKAYGDALRALCIRENIPFADVWNDIMTTLDGPENPGIVPGSLSEPKHEKLASYFRDGLHPVRSGYEIIYESIYSCICRAYPLILPGNSNPHTPYWSHAVAPKKGNLLQWYLDTTTWSREYYESELRRLPQLEQSRISKFLFPKDRNMALASVLLQRLFITDILGRRIETTEIIERDQSNRPFFKHKAVRKHDFNVSHHAGIVVLAGVLESGKIGVDTTVVEELGGSTASDYLKSFKDCFTAREWAQIDNQLVRFAQHWALKESYVKATGTGIVVDLQAIEFINVKYVDENTPLQANAASLSVSGEVESWKFQLHYLKGNFIAVCTESSVVPGMNPFTDAACMLT